MSLTVLPDSCKCLTPDGEKVINKKPPELEILSTREQWTGLGYLVCSTNFVRINFRENSSSFDIILVLRCLEMFER